MIIVGALMMLLSGGYAFQVVGMGMAFGADWDRLGIGLAILFVIFALGAWMVWRGWKIARDHGR